MEQAYQSPDEDLDLITRSAALDIYAGNVRRNAEAGDLRALRASSRAILQPDLADDGCTVREDVIRAKRGIAAREVEMWDRVIAACERDGWTTDVAFEAHVPVGLSGP
jgi:hypothetical protein